MWMIRITKAHASTAEQAGPNPIPMEKTAGVPPRAVGRRLWPVLRAGGDPVLYFSIEEAWAAAQGQTAEVKLLSNAQVSETLTVTDGSDITLTSGTDSSGNPYAICGNVSNADSGLIDVAAGGTFTGDADAILLKNVDGTLQTILGDKKAYYEVTDTGNVLITDLPSDRLSLPGTVIVEDCTHSCSTWTDGGNGNTHSGTCEVCGTVIDGPHEYDGNGFCTVCGGYEPAV